VNANLSPRAAYIGVELESRAEAVALVRSALAALAEITSLDPLLTTNLKTAVSEACNNVVLHAYGEAPGPMLVTVEVGIDLIVVTVRDHGRGIRQLAAGDDRMGLGLAVITALAARTEFSNPSDGGTEVRMSFDRHPGASRAQQLDAPRNDELPLDSIQALGGNVTAYVSPATLVGPVLGRLARAVAANSGFSVSRFEDLYPVADALGDQAERAADGALSFAIRASRRSMELVAGPFHDLGDGVERLGGLVDDVSVETTPGHELLHLTLVDRVT
jgi:serine/threonine-protein kinase RsbW